jgi:hypothetical protein
VSRGAIWHMLTDNVAYQELGGAYFTQRDPERATRRAVTQLNQLGYTVTLNLREMAPQPTNRQADDPLSMTRSVPTTAPAAGEAR